jgi:hypothetical protein
MKAPDIEFHIEELILHGFPQGERHRIGDALELELAALFAERGVPVGLSRDGALGQLDAGEFRVASDAGPRSISTQLAAAIYEGLTVEEKNADVGGDLERDGSPGR